jgi:hypothetical protein
MVVLWDVPEQPTKLNAALIEASQYGISGLKPLSKQLDHIDKKTASGGVPQAFQLPQPVPSHSSPQNPSPSPAKQDTMVGHGTVMKYYYDSGLGAYVCRGRQFKKEADLDAFCKSWGYDCQYGR